MNIREFSHMLQKLYSEMSDAFGKLQRDTQLPCLPECGRCCLNPDIEATPLEMIPMALKIFDEDTLEDWHQRLSEIQQRTPCLMFNGKGCGSYEERPSICRMFGVAGYLKKNEATLSICREIKDAHPEKVTEALKNLGPETPYLYQWTFRLETLDPNLTKDRRPINDALRIALEKVALWSRYDKG